MTPGSHFVVVRVFKVKSAAIEGNSKYSLLRLGSSLEQVVPGVLHVQEQVLALLVRPR
jgi:hypothetical protein